MLLFAVGEKEGDERTKGEENFTSEMRIKSPQVITISFYF